MKTDASNIHEHIRLEAYLLSEQAGHPTGMDETFWVQAEAIVHGRTAVVAGAGKSKLKAKTAKPTKKLVAAPTAAKATPEKVPTTPKTKASAIAKAKPAAKRAK